MSLFALLYLKGRLSVNVVYFIFIYRKVLRNDKKIQYFRIPYIWAECRLNLPHKWFIMGIQLQVNETYISLQNAKTNQEANCFTGRLVTDYW